jgi:hypothetical protein
MPRTVVILQSNYLPWRGYFDLLQQADEVVLLDSVQYTRRDWRNRNRIKTPQGPIWITVPVEAKGRYFQAIDETRVTSPEWAERHKRSIELAYRRAAGFSETAPWLFEAISAAAEETLLSSLNEQLLRAVLGRLAIRTPLRRCTQILDRDSMRDMEPTGRLVALCSALSATRYLSGPSAQAYLDQAAFTAVGIEVAWMDYGGYPAYPQMWGDFEPYLSIVDLLMNTGKDAARYVGRGRA